MGSEEPGAEPTEGRTVSDTRGSLERGVDARSLRAPRDTEARKKLRRAFWDAPRVLSPKGRAARWLHCVLPLAPTPTPDPNESIVWQRTRWAAVAAAQPLRCGEAWKLSASA